VLLEIVGQLGFVQALPGFVLAVHRLSTRKAAQIENRQIVVVQLLPE
jgi:hypothetical protein